MTDTNTLAPTDAELDSLAARLIPIHSRYWPDCYEFAHAVLAKWGAPAPASSDGESVAERCAAVCDSRSASLNRDGNHVAANEAKKCAGAIRARAISHASSEPVAVPAGMPEPAAWAATSEDGDAEALGMNQSRRFDTPLFTAAQVQAMLAAARNAPPQDPDAAAFAAWCCEMDDITAAPKGDQHAE